MMKKIKAPLSVEEIKNLKAGDAVLLSGTIFTARDQAHKRLTQMLKQGKKLPFDLKNAVIYYCGPTKTAKRKVIGACGPTTSSRMDEFTPFLLSKGLRATIGKGRRSAQVQAAIKKFKGIYFLTFAGCAAFLTKYVVKAKLLAFKDLGPEAVLKLEVKDFPVIVGIDSQGRSVYGKT